RRDYSVFQRGRRREPRLRARHHRAPTSGCRSGRSTLPPAIAHDTMTRLLTLLCLITILADARAASLVEAFTEGAQFGRSGNTAARSRIDTGTASATVPGYSSSAPAASYFGSPGLGAGATATINDCAMPGQMENPACQAVNFSQTNPGQRPSF